MTSFMEFKFKVLMLTSDVMLKPPHKISNEKTLNYYIFPRHTLPNLDLIYAISEVIILNNDQHEYKKKSTNNWINFKIKQQHILSSIVIVSDKFCFRKFFCCLQVCLTWKTFSCQTDMGNRVKHDQI